VSGHLLVFDDTSGSEAVVITDGEHKHVIRLDKDGISIEHGSAGHKISVSAQEITVKHGSAPSQITLSATGVTAKTAAATIELAGPAVKLNGGSMPVVRAGVDIGIGNLGAPVVMQPGNPTVLA
jgi:phage baseplate assembly protein gpV